MAAACDPHVPRSRRSGAEAREGPPALTETGSHWRPAPAPSSLGGTDWAAGRTGTPGVAGRRPVDLGPACVRPPGAPATRADCGRRRDLAAGTQLL